MLLRTVMVERVIPEYSASGEPVSYRLYARSASGWKYDYCLLHHTNLTLIESLLASLKLKKVEELAGTYLAAYVEGSRLIRLALPAG